MKLQIKAVLLSGLAACQIHPGTPTYSTALSLPDCAAGPGELAAARSTDAQFERSLAFHPHARGELSFTEAFTLTGRCAPLVEASRSELLRLDSGNVYRITEDGIVPTTVGPSTFERASLAQSEIPTIANAQFVHAVRVSSRRVGSQLANRYVGLWRAGNGSSTIAEFIVPPEGGRFMGFRTLLESRRPLRSVSFFPSPDTPSGSLWLVQAPADSQARVIRLYWHHGPLTI